MGGTLDRIFEVAEKMADTAATTTMTLVAKSKEQIDKCSLQNRLAKVQRQLGKLTYTQIKTGEENPDLAALFVQEIDEIQGKLDDLTPEKEPVTVRSCPACGEGVQKDAVFCSCCGQKLS